MLIVGTDSTKLLQHLPENFLLIDDGQLSDAIELPPRKKALQFDHRFHHFNPLSALDHLKIENFSAIIAAAFPAGSTTLTKENGLDEIEKALHDGAKSLARLIPEPEKGAAPEQQWAYRKIQKLLRNPVLNNVLLRPKNFSLKGIVLARLNRAELGDFTCFVLGNLLIGQTQGHVVVSDYGFYACPSHTTLIRLDRLTAQVNYLHELPEKLRNLLLMGPKQPAHCTFEDAETLAQYASLKPDPTRVDNPYNRYIDAAML